MLLCDISHVYFPISSLAYMRKKYFFALFFVVRCCLLYVGWWKKILSIITLCVCVHVCTCDRENEYMLVRNGLVNVSLDWGSWQLFIAAVFASPIAQKSLDYTFIDPTKNGISYSLSPYCQMKMKKRKKRKKNEEKHTENEKSCKNPSHSRKITRMWRKLKMKQSSCRYFASYLGVNMHAFTLCEWMTDTEHRTAISISHSILPYLRWWLFL